MTEHRITLVVEDDLSESVLRRIVRDFRPDLVAGLALGKQGFGYIKNRLANFNRSAAGVPFLILVDLDNSACPSELISKWSAGLTLHPNLLLRIAVREVESWLLADREHLADFLSVSETHLPRHPESIVDPKRCLVQAASKSTKRAIREGIAPAKGSTAHQGPSYNSDLMPYVQNFWNIEQASANSPSLKRMLSALARYKPST